MSTLKRYYKLILFFAILLVLLVGSAFFMAKHTIDVSTARALGTQEGQTEAAAEVDFYSMQKTCSKNAREVFKALQSGKTARLEKLLIDPEGAGDVMEFADWSKADFENAVSLGAGSLTETPDADGNIDVSEKFFVKAGDDRYVIFVETLASRLGRGNAGVSAVSVITYEDFDAAYFVWNGEEDKGGVTAGKLWWNRGESGEESGE